MPKYRLENSGQMNYIPIHYTFFDNYMPSANATYVKVYLYGLSQCYNSAYNPSHKQTAEDLGILESDVVNAWLYWEKTGIVNLKHKDGNKPEDFDIEFLDLSSGNIEQKQVQSELAPVLQVKPTYTPEEISIYIESDEGIKYMYTTAQKKLGKVLSSSDINILYSFYDWLRLPVEVIIMLIEYCATMGKKNMRYIEKVAIEWADKEITTMEKVEEYLKEKEDKHSLEQKVKKSLGINDRSLSESEKKYINKWLYDMNIDIELIKKAYDLTVINTGKLSLPYINTILKDWNKQGIKTVEETDKTPKKRARNAKPNKNNKFVNFTQRNYDYDELDAIVRKKNLNSLKERRTGNDVS